MSYEEFYRVYLPDLKGSGVQKRTVCPFCRHRDDLSINMATGQCKCFYGGCGFEGDVFDLLMKKENLTFSEAARKLERWGIKPVRERKYSETEEECNSSPTHPVTHEEMKKDVERFADTLRDDLRVFLREGRGLSSEVITRYRIGFAKEHPNYPARDRLSIPIPKDGEYCNIRFHSLKDEKPKDLPYREGLPYATWIFPEDQLENNEIWLCEGELDALCAISHGLPAVSVTGGAGSWKNEFTPLFKGKVVHIAYDCDPAGRGGAQHVAKLLLGVVKELKVIDLGLPESGDLTDYFQEKTKEQLEELVDITMGEKKTKPSKTKFNPRPYSLSVLRENHLEYDRYKRFWIFDKKGNIWKDTAELILNSILRKRILGDDDYKRYCVDEVIADLQGLTYREEIPEEPETSLIPFSNKIYDLRTDALIDYGPGYFFVNKLAVDMDEGNRGCPTIDTIFKQLVEPENVVSLYEILAYSLYRGYPYPKVFILYGPGGNGKSTYVKILTKVLGRDNVSLVSTNDLQSNRFASSQLFMKMLNVSGEMNYAILRNTSRLKQCCGEDLIYCERKFREPFPFVNYAKMIFLTNQVPLTADRTEAFYRRIFLLEFPNTFILGEDADPMIVERIAREEFEGLAFKCLQKLKELSGRGFVFTHHQRTEEITRKYEDLSNPLSRFLREYTQKKVNSHIAVGDFNDKYISFLEDQRLRAWSEKEIAQQMKSKGFAQKTLAGPARSTYRAWLGLGWR